MELTGSVFSIKRSSGDLISETLKEIECVRSNGKQTITVICDNPEDVRKLLSEEDKTRDWVTTHVRHEDHEQEQSLRKSFKELIGCIHLTTVTLAQGWDFENVIFICTTENDGQKNTLENVLTGATRAKNSMWILDRTASGWLYDTLKDLSQS